MAKEAAKTPETPAANSEPSAPKKKGPMKLLVVALGVVALEAGTVGATMMMSGGPKRAVAEVPATAPAEAVEKEAEVPIVDAKLPNKQQGRLFLYDIQVVANVGEKNKEKVTELLAERQALIKDRIRTIVASSDPASLGEPGLETLRRQIGYQLEQDLGKELIKELLIPKCTPIRVE